MLEQGERMYYSKRGQKHSRDFIGQVALKINGVNKICIRCQRSSSDKMRFFRDTNFYQGDRKGKPLTKCVYAVVSMGLSRN